MQTIRGTFLKGIGKPKLDKVFADAEKWYERDESDDGWTVAWRGFVRHPRYPECTMMVEATMVPMEGAGPGVSRVKIKRTISDNGKTPVSAISQIARYSIYVSEFMQRRHGGLTPTPEKDKLRAVEGWLSTGLR